MEIRYNGLQIVNGFPDTDGQLGDLETLLEWHRNDPPDDFEMNRNNVIYNWQRNRNPLIDQPDLVEYLWGDQVGEVWNQSVATQELDQLNVQVYPNPTANRIYIEGLQNRATVNVYAVDGRKLNTYTVMGNSEIDLNLPGGTYLLTIHSGGKLKTVKVVVSEE
jgi:hypothetical protein